MPLKENLLFLFRQIIRWVVFTFLFIIGAVKNKIKKDDSEIEDVIKIWLKHAPQRMKNSKQNHRT